MLIEHHTFPCGEQIRIFCDAGHSGYFWEPEDYDGDAIWDGPYPSIDEAIEAAGRLPCECTIEDIQLGHQLERY